MFHCGLRMGTFCSSFILYNSITEADMRQSVSRQLHASFLNITWTRYNKFHSWAGWINIRHQLKISIASLHQTYQTCYWYAPEHLTGWASICGCTEGDRWFAGSLISVQPWRVRRPWSGGSCLEKSPMSIHDDTLSWFKTCETNIESMSST